MLLKKLLIGILFVLLNNAANALNLSEIVGGVAADITVVKVKGSCGANPFFGEAPCLPTRATCPDGKIPVPIKTGGECTSSTQGNFDYNLDFSVVPAKTNVVASGYVECNPKSNYYWDGYNYYPSMVGYSPLCNSATKACQQFSYTVAARCVTSPKQADITKLGIIVK